jgi:HNH endonuclease
MSIIKNDTLNWTYDKILEKLYLYTIFDQNECWLWNGGKSGGYGVVKIDITQFYVHRISAEIFLGHKINNNMLVLHKCDIRNCFNPDHLFIGTHEDNMNDCVKKNRHPEGKKTHCIHNHELTHDNIYKHGGKRYCRKCKDIREAARPKRSHGRYV